MVEDIEILRDFFERGGTLQALMSLEPTDLDHVYAHACQLFDAGDYSASKRFYLLLVRLSHWQFDYWLALGVCCQRMEEHTEALFCFGQAGLLRLDDPRPAYLAGLSHRTLGQAAKALKAFSAATKVCASKAEYAELKAEVVRQATVTPQDT